MALPPFQNPPIHITLPVIPQSPLWHDQNFIVQNQQPERRHQTPPNPRPRKPYTTTKVREMWSPSEHQRMLEGLRLYKRDWAKVTSFVGTRSPAQVRSHAQKYFDRVARDNTDEYVPRARPKRKSSTPYPRKLRDDLSKTHTVRQPMPSYPVPVAPVVHPSPSYDIQPVFAQHIHHPVRIAPGQSPILSHVPSPQYIAPPTQHTVSAQVALPHRVYSPFMEMSPNPNPNPHRGTVHAPEIQASPLSYVSGQTYAPTHSPSIAQQTISIPTASMYGVLSPITPGAFSFSSGRPSSVTHTPLTVYGQSALVQANVQMPTPRHSHPEGPIDNCAKCVALQRYGAVLQEIGEINYSPTQQDPQIQHGRSTPTPSLMIDNPARPTHPPKGASQQREHGRRVTNHIQDPSSSGSLSPPKERLYSPALTSSDDRNEGFALTAPAGNRAYRAKVMKARKLKQRSSTTKDTPRNPSRVYDGQSESANSTQEDRHRILQAKSATVGEQLPSAHTTGAFARKRKVASRKNHGTEKGPVLKKQRKRQHSGTVFNETGHKDNRLKGKCQQVAADRQKGLEDLGRTASNGIAANDQRSPSPKSDESETGPHSPLVDETYTSRERMELFDAVHSLQILAKTSSSGSPSSPSSGDPRRSAEE